MEIKDIITNYVGNILNKEKFYTCAGTVQSVNKENKTCSVKLVTDEVVDEVRLETDLIINESGDVVQADPSGFFIVPAKGSVVLISFLNKTGAFVSLYSTIDEVVIKSTLTTFNGGSHGGLINIADQVSKLNGLVNELSTELIKIQTGITGAGGAYTPGTLSQFDGADFEDEKVKH